MKKEFAGDSSPEDQKGKGWWVERAEKDNDRTDKQFAIAVLEAYKSLLASSYAGEEKKYMKETARVRTMLSEVENGDFQISNSQGNVRVVTHTDNIVLGQAPNQKDDMLFFDRVKEMLLKRDAKRAIDKYRL